MTTEASARVSTRLIFPVGFFGGPFHPAQGAPVRHHALRVGRTVRRLDEASTVIWGLAHATTDAAGRRPWTRLELLAAARDLGLRVSGAEVDALLADGSLAEVSPDGDDAVTFARHHRLAPLLTGLGNAPERPLGFGIGLPGEPPVVVVEHAVFEVWMWSEAAGSLWELAETLAGAGQQGSSTTAALAGILGNLHQLLAHGAAYLDRIDPV